MEIKLTEKSKNKLMNWHAGSGVMYLSEGTGNSFTCCDIFFRKTIKGYILSMGNSKFIVLTKEQADVLGCYAKEMEKEE